MTRIFSLALVQQTEVRYNTQMSQDTMYILEKHPFYGITLKIKKNNKSCSAFSSDISNTLRNLLRATLDHQDISQKLEQWLENEADKDVVLHIKDRHNISPCTWDPTLFHEQKISLNLDNGKVFVSEKSQVKGLMFLSDLFFVDLNQNKVGRIKVASDDEKQALEALFDTAKKNKVIPQPLSHYLNQDKGIESAVFNSLNISVVDDNLPKRKNFLVASQAASVSNKDSALTLSIYYKKEEPWVKLRLYYEGDELSLPCDQSIQKQSEAYVKRLTVTKKQRVTLLRCILKILNSSNPERMISYHLNRLIPDQSQYQLAKEILENIQNEKRYLQAFDGQWLTAPASRKKEQLLWLALNLLFEEDFQHFSQEDVHLLPQDVFFEQYSLLEAVLTACGIERHFTEKAFELIEHDIHLDLGDLSDLSTLPELFVDNSAIDFKEFEKMGTNIWQEMNAHQDVVIHPNTIRKVQQVLNLLNFQKKEKKSDTLSISVKQHFHLLDWIELRKSGIKITLSQEQEDRINSFMNFKSLTTISLPKKLKADPRAYQKESLHWFAFLYQHNLGAILADDMGLGKTFQAIQFLAALHEGLIKRDAKKACLIVMPPSLIYNWENELMRFYPDFKVSLYVGSERRIHDDSDIILSTYEIIRRDIDALKEIEFDTIVFDESQFIKNSASARSKACKELSANFRLCLTGTPMENHVGEYVSMLDLILPGFSQGIQLNDLIENNIYDILLKRSKVFVLRRLKEEILDELPKKSEENIYLTMSDTQKQYYSALIKSVKGEFNNKDKKGSNNIMILTLLMRLRQVCLSPRLIDEAFEELTPKYDYLINKLSTLHEEGYSALVFTQFKTSLDIIQSLCEKHKIKAFRLDGSTTPVKRKK